MKKYFCEFCNKNVNTKIEHKKITVNYEYIDSETEMPEIKKVPVTADVRVCRECGGDVYDEELEDKIIKLINENQEKYKPEPTYPINLCAEEIYELISLLKVEFDVCMEHVTDDGVFIPSDDGKDRLHMKLTSSTLLKLGLTVKKEDIDDPFENLNERMFS